MWVCGLKHQVLLLSDDLRQVAPYVGVWIETKLNYYPMNPLGRTLCGCVD